MHIERILLRAVGPFDDVTIELPKGSDPSLADVYLLTGPNGTGKSTVLYALAAVIAGGADQLGRDLLADRMRSREAVVAVRTDEREIYVVTHRDHAASMLDLGREFGPVGQTSVSTRVRHYQHTQGVPRYSRGAAALHAGSTVAAFGWAAFAYAGIRSVSDVHITAVQEPRTAPLENSLSFLQTAETDQLANWIASQNFRRLKAKEAGHQDKAEQLARSVRDIESIVGEIVDDPSFAFVITDEDDDIRVRWNGVTLRLGLLPDGLKSIISWVADLLMRLDRIPWQDGTPVMQRQFLLLLDEIDIHLHPAWQRRVLPLVQRMFPNAQIIASTHSPFVVASAADASIITLGLRGQSSVVEAVAKPQLGVSYSAILRSIFGIDSEFDIDTERTLHRFHEARQRLLAGDGAARAEVDQLAEQLAHRSEELRELVALELGQLRRQLAVRAAP